MSEFASKAEKPISAYSDRSLSLFLEMMVPITIHDLAMRGGPSDADYERLNRDRAEDGTPITTTAEAVTRDEAALKTTPGLDQPLTWLTNRADDLLVGRGKKGERGTGMASIAKAVAVMAFHPLGVRFDGMIWDCGMPGLDGVCGAIRGVAPVTIRLLEAIREEKLRDIHARHSKSAMTLYVTAVRTRHRYRSTKRNRRG